MVSHQDGCAGDGAYVNSSRIFEPGPFNFGLRPPRRRQHPFSYSRAGAGGKNWVNEEGAAVIRLVDDLVTAADGSISAEHGIGQMKRDEFARLNPDRVAAIRAIKAGLDPKGLMNPGKLV